MADKDLADVDDAQLVQRAARELEQILTTYGPMELALQPSSAFTLASVLQLALRHPGIHGEPRRIAIIALEHIRGYLQPAPAVQEMLRRGDDPAYDVHSGSVGNEAAARKDG